MTMLAPDELDQRAAPGTYPLPPDRGLWRLTLHQRVFSNSATYPSTTGLSELVSARSRTLTQAWDASAQLSFTVDGHSPQAMAALELQTDVIAWRWDDQTGKDIPLFRGPITQSEDVISEQEHTVTYTCHDYVSLLQRRIVTSRTPLIYTQVDQDDIVRDMLARANRPLNTAGQDVFWPGSALPLAVQVCNPDGTTRVAPSGQKRDRSYFGNAKYGDELDSLAKVINGFDYDVLPRSDLNGVDYLRVFYPQQGTLRNQPGLVYGSTVSNLTRSLNSTDYANYVRVLGNNNNSSDQNAPQFYAELANADANNVSAVPIGLWMRDITESDVIIQATLNDKAAGDLGMDGILQPTYSVGLTPGTYSLGYPNMGDTVPLVVQSGRLNVSTQVRVLAIAYNIGDDGQEDVVLTVGRPTVNLSTLLARQARQVNALGRR